MPLENGVTLRCFRMILAASSLAGCSPILGADSFSDLPSGEASGSLGDYHVDIDGDGKDDYLVVDDHGAVQAWVNHDSDGDPGWIDYGEVVHRMNLPSTQVRFADINGDHKADYLAMNGEGALHAWINDTSDDQRDHWIDADQIAAGVGIPSSQVRLADYDGDGSADYLTVDDSSAVSAWINHGGDAKGGWTPAGVIAVGVRRPGRQIRFADMDGDGKADYLAIDDDGALRVWINRFGTPNPEVWLELGQVFAGGVAASSRIRL